ncbi:uncharacterized protein LOC119680700 [Teleopsis dalmanni]|uniref:uncharacterized protein LOC119680700 n=1 Tax=Teleopsis dalmanni TaxID=139649 RepID=UPI0018CEE234|nr:uncharacterized protein LOC119680700 [Teleopsis dalmanni]
MNTERQLAKPGGQSLIALIMPSPIAYVSESDERYCLHFLDNLNYTLPDINILFYAGGAVIRFKSFVWDPEDDLFLLSLDNSVERSAEHVIKRIRKEPRRITNPHCGADWQPNKSAMNAMMQTVRPGGINFYRMAPNYFFDRKSMRYIQVDANNAVTVTVCFSREVRYPHREGSLIPANQDCRQITSLSQSYDLTDACTGYDTILQCPPLYMSVQAQTFADSTQVSCTDEDCQSPDQVRYTIFVNNLTCNAAIRIRWGYLNALSIILIVLCIFYKIF